ncbi:MAG TPA: alpha/beta hydrolase [Jatrophihabitantaceae bacterium]
MPGLRGHVPDHWQTRLEAKLPNAISVPGLGSSYPSLDDRVALLNRIVEDVDRPVTLVAHSAGVLTVVHWAARLVDSAPVAGALLVTPPTLAAPLPAPYPPLAELRANGWLPVPTTPLPFPSIVAASTNDALGEHERVRSLAEAWGSRFHSLGAVGHLNPASGYGDWPEAEVLLDELSGALVG